MMSVVRMRPSVICVNPWGTACCSVSVICWKRVYGHRLSGNPVEGLERTARYGLLTQPQPIGDQREADEADEQGVELVEAREDAPEAFEAPEQPLDLVAALVHLAVVLPGLYSGPGRRHDRDEAQIEGELDRLVARVGTVHQQVQRAAGWSQARQQLAAHRSVAGLAR